MNRFAQLTTAVLFLGFVGACDQKGPLRVSPSYVARGATAPSGPLGPASSTGSSSRAQSEWYGPTIPTTLGSAV